MTLVQSLLGLHFLNSAPSELTYGLSVFTVVVSSISTFIFFTILEILSFRSPRLRFGLHIGAVAIYVLFWIFQAQTKSLLGFTLVEENFFQIFAPEALAMLFGEAGPRRLGFALFCAILLIPIEQAIARRQTFGTVLYGKRISLGLGLLYFLLCYSFPLVDPVAYFLQDAGHLTRLEWQIHQINIGKEFPYVKNTVAQLPKITSQPHVFLLQIESFNANFVEKKSPEGITYTPFYNSLIGQGLYVDKFYGPSIQTARGQFMIHCGIPESLTAKSFIAYYRHRFHCLPDVLKAAGFTTLYFHNYNNGNYDNGGPFLARNGFDTVKAMDTEFLQAGDRRFIWGWGLQDDKFYQKFFRYLDGVERQNPGQKRYFSSLLTVSSHMMFDQVPRRQRYVYAFPRVTNQHYANAIRVTDEYLREFIGQLRARPYLQDSLIIITGDHSFPVGEHGNYDNAVGYYEESFRTPFLLIWNGHVSPHRETEIAYSQLDIAPTLLHLLHLEVPNHFAGISMFEKQSTQHVIPLIQPYGGIYVGNVLYPFKYIKHLASGKEFLYNLAADKNEAFNLIDSPNFSGMIEERRQSLKTLFLNQALLNKDQIWPTNLELVKGPYANHNG